MLLSKAEADAIEARSARVEARVGAQVIAAIVGKADAHVELPWKAFTLGAVLSGLAIVVADALRPQWVTADAALIEVRAHSAFAIAATFCRCVAGGIGRGGGFARRQGVPGDSWDGGGSSGSW